MPVTVPVWRGRERPHAAGGVADSPAQGLRLCCAATRPTSARKKDAARVQSPVPATTGVGAGDDVAARARLARAGVTVPSSGVLNLHGATAAPSSSFCELNADIHIATRNTAILRQPVLAVGPARRVRTARVLGRNGCGNACVRLWLAQRAAVRCDHGCRKRWRRVEGDGAALCTAPGSGKCLAGSPARGVRCTALHRCE